MCLIQFQKKDTLQSENQGVMIHSSGTQCMQIKIENEPYTPMLLGGVLKLAPVSDPQDSLPTFFVPDAPFAIGLSNHLAIINRGLMEKRRGKDSQVRKNNISRAPWVF
ncbi:hypothetical protein TCAL_15437 [Tigriopus californicus]|uniref:Uncharacterized protein n=1 Tax=Tigriopus californicus TaxID=6832 RepID=A0A553PRB9_TIGCA|nr:hypothetical protein TCAL_15437 [Tigriopus californicus]